MPASLPCQPGASSPSRSHVHRTQRIQEGVPPCPSHSESRATRSMAPSRREPASRRCPHRGSVDRGGSPVRQGDPGREYAVLPALPLGAIPPRVFRRLLCPICGSTEQPGDAVTVPTSSSTSPSSARSAGYLLSHHPGMRAEGSHPAPGQRHYLPAGASDPVQLKFPEPHPGR